MADNIVHILNEKGHRGAYLNLFASELNMTPHVKSISSKKNIFKLLKAERVLFASMNVGKTFKWYFMISMVRALLMKPTCLLLLGVNFLDNSQSNDIKFKKYCMRVWKYFYRQSVITITPYYLDERLQSFTKDYIYDPQMWDMHCENYSKYCNINSDYARKYVVNPEIPVVVFLGQAYRRKGLKEFVEFVKANKDMAQFIIAGKFPEENLAYADRLRKLGVKVINEFLEESEFLGFYEIADYMWCYYKPSYDQTSGVFGRATQLGVVPIVRENSIINRIAKKHNLACVELNFENGNSSANISDFLTKKEGGSDIFFDKIKTESLDKLKTYLYM